MTIQEAIKCAMKAKKVTQGEVANRIGTGQSNLSMQLKSGNRMIVDNLLKMANACGYDIALVDREDPKNAYVIGDNDTIGSNAGDESFDARVRTIINEELRKRGLTEEERKGTKTTLVEVVDRIPEK